MSFSHLGSCLFGEDLVKFKANSCFSPLYFNWDGLLQSYLKEIPDNENVLIYKGLNVIFSLNILLNMLF